MATIETTTFKPAFDVQQARRSSMEPNPQFETPHHAAVLRGRPRVVGSTHLPRPGEGVAGRAGTDQSLCNARRAFERPVVRIVRKDSADQPTRKHASLATVRHITQQPRDIRMSMIARSG
jgi:hypothetical protein